MANNTIDKNKISKEPENNRIANGGGVGSTDLLGFKLLYFFYNIGHVFFEYIQLVLFGRTKKTMNLSFCMGFVPFFVLVPYCIYFGQLALFDFSPDTNDTVFLQTKECIQNENVIMFPALNVDKRIPERLKPEGDFFIISSLFGEPKFLCKIASKSDERTYKHYKKRDKVFNRYYVIDFIAHGLLIMSLMFLSFVTGRWLVFEFNI